MASTKADRINVQGERNPSIDSTNEPVDRNCPRCGGLLVLHICMDLYNTGDELESPARRCVQCGEVLDTVILRNRRLRYESSVAHRAQTTSFSQKTHVAELNKAI